MNAVTSIESAYRQLTAPERSFVDDVIRVLQQNGERIRAAIDQRITEIATQEEVHPNKWVSEVAALAFSSMGNYCRIEVDDLGNEYPVFDFSACTPEHWAAIKSLECETSGDGLSRPMKTKIKVTLHDKVQTLTMIGKYMGMVEPDNPHWKADVARQVAPTLPQGATPEQAGDEYAKMLGE